MDREIPSYHFFTMWFPRVVPVVMRSLWLAGWLAGLLAGLAGRWLDAWRLETLFLDSHTLDGFPLAGHAGRWLDALKGSADFT